MQILHHYYEQTSLAIDQGVGENFIESNSASAFSLDALRPQTNLTSQNKPSSEQTHGPDSLPVHFFLQNLHYQRLNHSIHAASKEKRKHKGQQ